MAQLKVPSLLTAFSIDGQTIKLERDIIDVQQEQSLVWQSHGFEPTNKVLTHRRDRIDRLLSQLRASIETLNDEQLLKLTSHHALRHLAALVNQTDHVPLHSTSPVPASNSSPAKTGRKPKA